MNKDVHTVMRKGLPYASGVKVDKYGALINWILARVFYSPLKPISDLIYYIFHITCCDEKPSREKVDHGHPVHVKVSAGLITCRKIVLWVTSEYRMQITRNLFSNSSSFELLLFLHYFLYSAHFTDHRLPQIIQMLYHV